MLFYTYLPNEPLSKERVEAFSDGVYAIVATLLILDIWLVALPLLLESAWASVMLLTPRPATSFIHSSPTVTVPRL